MSHCSGTSVRQSQTDAQARLEPSRDKPSAALIVILEYELARKTLGLFEVSRLGATPGVHLCRCTLNHPDAALLSVSTSEDYGTISNRGGAAKRTLGDLPPRSSLDYGFTVEGHPPHITSDPYYRTRQRQANKRRERGSDDQVAASPVFTGDP